MIHTYNELGSYEQYMSYVNGIERLTDEQEVELLHEVQRGQAERLQPHPDAQVLEVADKSYLRLVDTFQRLRSPHCSSTAPIRKKYDLT